MDALNAQIAVKTATLRKLQHAAEKLARQEKRWKRIAGHHPPNNSRKGKWMEVASQFRACERKATECDKGIYDLEREKLFHM